MEVEPYYLSLDPMETLQNKTKELHKDTNRSQDKSNHVNKIEVPCNIVIQT